MCLLAEQLLIQEKQAVERKMEQLKEELFLVDKHLADQLAKRQEVLIYNNNVTVFCMAY
jgi:hypothetical protein